MNTPSNTQESEWLTFGEVKLKIESCFDVKDGSYTLGLWLCGDAPLLPKRYIPGRKRAVYSRERVELLLKPKSQPALLSRP